MRHKGKKRTKTRKSLLLGSKVTNTYLRYYWFGCDEPTNKLELLFTTCRRDIIQGGESYYSDPLTNMIYKQGKSGGWAYKRWFFPNGEYTTDSKVAHAYTIAATLNSL
jgi:hypothetical protein